MPGWYSQHGGAVLTSTLDKYCYISLREMPAYLGHKYRVIWNKMETVDRIEDIEHPGVRGCLVALGVERGLEVNHAGDLPARSGLGSSSAFTVGMVKALHEMIGLPSGPQKIAMQAINIEQNVLGETVGIQDQIACAYGGFNLIEIGKDGHFLVRPLHLPVDTIRDLEKRLVLFFTGIQRYSSDIQDDQVANASKKQFELKAIQDLVPVAHRALTNGQLDKFGELLHEPWMLKLDLSDKSSNPAIDDIYGRAMDAHALGGKVLGAGGGGFMLFYTRDPDALRKALPELLECPFSFGFNGSQVMVST